MRSKSKYTQRTQPTPKVTPPIHSEKTFSLSPRMVSLINYAIISILLLTAATFMWVYEKDVLFRIQEQSLFLSSSLFFEELMLVPGGFASYIGAFLTQFLYYPWAGIAIWLLLMCAITFTAKKALAIPNKWMLLALLPVAMLLCAQMDQGYWIYYQKLKGYFFTPSCTVLCAFAAAWLFRVTKQPIARYTILVVWVAASYFLLGALSSLGTLTMLAISWSDSSHTRGQKIMTTAMGIATSLIIPLVAYRIYNQLGMSYIYTAGMPNFNWGEEEYPWFRIPFYVMVLSGLMALLPWQKIKLDRPIHWGVSQFILTLGLVVTVHHFWYNNDNFRREIAMTRALESQQWQEVVTLAKSEHPTRLMTLYRNYALLHLGRVGEEMYHGPIGTAHPVAPFKARMMQIGGRELYYHYGRQNFCFRWCMEDCVENGARVTYLKYMTKSALLSNEWLLAKRYIEMLKKTLFHKTWAEQYEAYLHKPEMVTNAEEFKSIIPFREYNDQIDGDNSLVEMYLLSTLGNANSDEPLYQEATLMAAMNIKDIKLFWPRFFKYATINKGKQMPRHYQEAALLYGTLEKEVDISKMPFDASVKESFKEFNQFSEKCKGMTQEQMKKAFYPKFGKTFFYFYYLVREEKSY